MTDLRRKNYSINDPRLGRHVAHDPRSLNFPAITAPVDPALWVSRSVRVYDPAPNPNQVIGDCTGVSKCVQMNAVGNRKAGHVLDLRDADRVYAYATFIDPYLGTYPPEDSGSNGLAACKAAQYLGIGGEYRWLFGADQVVQAVMNGWTVSVGTRWDQNMFNPDDRGFIFPGGAVAGGHQWTVRGYNRPGDYVIGRCWWGEFRDFKMKRKYLAELLADDGDAHVQVRV